MNSCTMSGTVSNEVKLRNGTYGAYSNTSISCLNGDKKVFIPIIAYGELAEKLSRVSLGSKICISGILDTYKDSQDVYRLSVVVKDFEILEGQIVSTLQNREYW